MCILVHDFLVINTQSLLHFGISTIFTISPSIRKRANLLEQGSDYPKHAATMGGRSSSFFVISRKKTVKPTKPCHRNSRIMWTGPIDSHQILPLEFPQCFVKMVGFRIKESDLKIGVEESGFELFQSTSVNQIAIDDACRAHKLDIDGLMFAGWGFGGDWNWGNQPK